MKKIFPVLFIAVVVVIFFFQFFAKGMLPIPSDTIIGLYHPFRDLYAKDYPRGIPFKNSLITDPVRQQYPWRQLVIEVEKKFELPLWNPYSFAGAPLLANFQSAVFYPFNILFFILPFNISWSFLIFLQPLLAGMFLYFYLSNLKLSKESAILGAIVFSFSGFFTAWFEWGTILNTALWLPLILLSIDKLVLSRKDKKIILWEFVYLASFISSFFAGHLQTFFYLFIITAVYLLARWFQYGKKINVLFSFLIFYIMFFTLTSVQWLPTLQFILHSARNVDLNWQGNGWFIPWEHLVQFIAPDFFGSPVTLNYFGVWNWGEFIGYVGIIPLISSLFALFFRRDKKTLFFGTAFFISLIFALPTFFAKIPFTLHIPFIDTSQPTRLLFITDFSLAVLAALGFDYFKKAYTYKGIIYPLLFIGFIFISLWGFLNIGKKYFQPADLSVAKHNLIFPTLIFAVSAAIILSYFLIRRYKNNKLLITAFSYIVIIIVVFDLLRFDLKFNPFTPEKYLFPSTSTISFLQKNIGNFRIMTTDPRIFTPNFSAIYKIQSVEGYDPLYLLNYGQLVAASERGKPNINPPFGFNRIITPHNFSSEIINLLGVKYVLSLSDINSPNLTKVFQEGQTRVYENKKASPRTFFVKNVIVAYSSQEAIDKMFSINLQNSAVVQNYKIEDLSVGISNITSYAENRVDIETQNSGDGLLVLTDSFYPTWHGLIDGKETKIFLTDFNFRGILVPAGKHKIEFVDRFF